MSLVAEALETIERALVKDRDLIARLEAARSALVADREPRRARISVSAETTTRRPRRRKAPSGSREAEVLGLIAGAPGITSTQLVRTVGTSGPQTYNVIGRLLGKGSIRGSHQGWRVAGRPEKDAVTASVLAELDAPKAREGRGARKRSKARA